MTAETEECYSRQRRLFAIRVRMGEKRVLRKLRDVLRAYFYTLSNPVKDGQANETEAAAGNQTVAATTPAKSEQPQKNEL